jgi:uncharacterized membrane protein
MTEKRSKYDTDPLDPEFARKTGDVWTGAGTQPVDNASRTGHVGEGGETRVFDRGANSPAQPRSVADPAPRYAPDSEAPTRRIDDAIPHAYPSVFVPPPYQAPPATQTYAPPPETPHGLYGARPFAAERNVAGLGIPERYANVAAYAPFYIGLVVSVIELLIAPRSEARTRYHAAQALGLHLAILAVGFVLSMIGGIGGVRVGAVLFSLASTAFLIYSMVKVWNGEQHRLGPLADVTRFLDERVDPRK